jgi:hypothetical protein
MEIEKQTDVVEKGVRGHVHFVEHNHRGNLLVFVERQNRRLDLAERVAATFAKLVFGLKSAPRKGRPKSAPASGRLLFRKNPAGFSLAGAFSCILTGSAAQMLASPSKISASFGG